MELGIKKLLFIIVFTSVSIFNSSAQEVLVKSNLLYDATTSVNVGVEFGLKGSWTLDVSGNYNPWSFSDKKWKHWFLQPEARYWLSDKFTGHFVGTHLLGGEYNVGGIDFPMNILGDNFDKEYRYEGWFIGGGVVYGYSWKLSSRWNIEASVGVGYVGTDYDKYECVECGDWVSDGFEGYLGLTKASVSIVYILK